MSRQSVAEASPSLPESLTRLRIPGLTRKSRHEVQLDGCAVDGAILAACSHAMRHLGGPKLERIGILSSVHGEGRSSIAAGITLAQAQDYGRPTLLLDIDFDGPRLADRFGVPPAPGISELLRGRVSLDRALQQVGDNVTLMPAGEMDMPASRLATEFVGSGLVTELQMDFPAIVADLPPLLGSPSGVLLAEVFETTVLVVRAESTPISTVREALYSIKGSPVVMLNGTRSSLPGWLRRFFI